MKRYILNSIYIVFALALTLPMVSCEDTTSYSDLLRDEEHAVNWFLSNRKVEVNIPEDNKFIVGEDAPFYKLDEDGNVYMQVLNMGTPDTEWKEGDKVYFRFMRKNIQTMYAGMEAVPEGNADNLSSSPTFFIIGNTVLESTTQYGEGIQLPTKYLGYDSEVNLVMKASQGFTIDQNNCIPFLYKIKYYKAVY